MVGTIYKYLPKLGGNDRNKIETYATYFNDDKKINSLLKYIKNDLY